MDSDGENIDDIDESAGQIEVQFKSETGMLIKFSFTGEKSRKNSVKKLLLEILNHIFLS